MAIMVRAAAIGVVAAVLGGCAGTQGLAQDDTRKDQWIVDEPIVKVFRAYKGHAEQKYSGGDVLWAEGPRVEGYFYGEEAELSILIHGNPFVEGPFLHIDMVQLSDSTQVTTRASNGPWQRIAREEFKPLL